MIVAVMLVIPAPHRVAVMVTVVVPALIVIVVAVVTVTMAVPLRAGAGHAGAGCACWSQVQRKRQPDHPSSASHTVPPQQGKRKAYQLDARAGRLPSPLDPAEGRSQRRWARIAWQPPRGREYAPEKVETAGAEPGAKARSSFRNFPPARTAPAPRVLR